MRTRRIHRTLACVTMAFIIPAILAAATGYPDVGSGLTTRAAPVAIPEPAAGETNAAKPDYTAGRALVAGNTRFALDLYSELKGTEGNILFSPYSISAALAMAYGGARNDTEREIAEALHLFPGQAGVHHGFAELLRGLEVVTDQGSVELHIGNSLWPSAQYPLREEYLSLIEDRYGSRVTSLDYQEDPERARRTINDWVGIRTRERIGNFIRPGDLDPSTVMVLVNAVWLKASWATGFNPEDTIIADFRMPDGGVRPVPMMAQRGMFRYAEFSVTWNEKGVTVPSFQALEMPYEGGRMSMCLLLPGDAGGLSRLEDALSAENLESWFSGLAEEPVAVNLPRFSFSGGSVDLADSLRRLGIREAFTGAADFSGMDGSGSLFISFVLHQAFIEVDEEGTEAAASTAVGMKKGPAGKAFRADHPFLFVIRDNETGSILFLGRVLDPAA